MRFSLLFLFYIQSSHTITPCLWKKQKHFVILIICAAWREVNQYLVCTLGQNGGYRVIQHTATFHLMEACTGLGHTHNQCKRKHFLWAEPLPKNNTLFIVKPDQDQPVIETAASGHSANSAYFFLNGFNSL